ncbi:activator of spomin\\x3a\\x3aLUC2 [Striga hermonthica]|uniref:Activator of spomin\x3a\x3aLUC2 n=1 Tax=Striga hermonthica TaxID=68872 RepID=A0A9N7NS33_STRHE|nr:activator of spomin\\x3a\\x3aLUC2 [Striga hermonthica]
MNNPSIPLQQLPDYYTLAPQSFDYNNNMVTFKSTSLVQDCMAVPCLSERDSSFPDFGYTNRVFEPGEQEISSELLIQPDHFWSAHQSQVAPDINWGLLQSQQGVVPNVEECHEHDEVKVIGRYSAEERKRRILRYLKKRNQRNFNKTIKYECRKTLADKRVRIRGRFAKNNEQNETFVGTAGGQCYEQNFSFLDDESTLEPQQIICDDDDDWLQAAMASLLNLPYPAG